MRLQRLVGLLAASLLLISGCGTLSDSLSIAAGGPGAEWDPGNIISDSVFYDSSAMTAPEIQLFLDSTGTSCTAAGCLRNLQMSTPAMTSQWCQPYLGGTNQSFAIVLASAAVACGINPQVALVMIQKESQGLTRLPPAALTGFGCPDSGPGGAPNCNAGVGGVFAQTYGMLQAFAHLKADPLSGNRYPPGQTSNILWNVEETGCGSGPVAVKNIATSTLYVYTPYQPNQAALNAYPGPGDRCSAYGNRNFFRMFQGYFGSTGGGTITAGTGTQVAPGFMENPSQDPSSFGWVRAGAMAPYSFQGHSFGQVAKGTEKLWDALLTDLVPLIPGGLDGFLGCYENRQNVNNPSKASFHSYGLACDLNYDRNPNGSSAAGLQGGQFVLPMETSAIAAKWGFEWGGDFRGTPDSMHLELHLTPQQVAAWAGGVV